MEVDWDAWQPGDRTAAEIIAGPRLQELLDASGIDLPVAAFRIGELSGILGATLASDEMSGPVTKSVQSLARQLESVVDNPEDAAPVAHILMALAQSAAPSPSISSPASGRSSGARRKTAKSVPAAKPMPKPVR
jgi:hypothetical protein